MPANMKAAGMKYKMGGSCKAGMPRYSAKTSTMKMGGSVIKGSSLRGKKKSKCK